MDIFKSSYIYIYMRGIASAQGMLSTGAQGSWGGTEAWRGRARGTELGHAGLLRHGAELRPCWSVTWRAPEFNKSGVKAICHGIFEE